MHIIIDARTANNHFPGIGRYVVSLSSALRKIQPDYLLTLLRDPSSEERSLTLPDLPVIDCPLSPFSIGQQWIIPRLLRDLKGNLYHSPYYLMPYRLKIPTVLTCYDLIPLFFPKYFTMAQRCIYFLAHLLAFKTSDMILSISRSTKADMIRYFRIAPDKIVTTPLAVDKHFSPQSSKKISFIKEKYNLPDHYVLYLGTNRPHKNLPGLIKAWQLFASYSKIPNFKLIIAGSWDQRYPQARYLVEKMDLKDRIAFLGPVGESDLPALYSGASLFLFPSLYEGFGLPVLEAMACGTPVICSGVSSLPEIAGDAAFLVDPLNTQDIATAIQKVLEDVALRQKMKEKGQVQAARFTWEQTAQLTLTAYAHCLENDRSGKTSVSPSQQADQQSNEHRSHL